MVRRKAWNPRLVLLKPAFGLFEQAHAALKDNESPAPSRRAPRNVPEVN
jgi:hypothetical protein